MKNSYTVVVERDPESKWLVGEVVELPGCYTQTPDLPTLESNIREAISVYLKTASPEEPLPDRISTDIWFILALIGNKAVTQIIFDL
jgi:predicted RNase H-like HicB family nuclease